MPELTTRHGYYVTLGVIVSLGLVLFSVFKRNRWL
jgi:Mg2+ and Co2+ transporter CorA